MSSLCLVAASLVTHGQAPGWQLAVPQKTLRFLPIGTDQPNPLFCGGNPHSAVSRSAIYEAAIFHPEFSQRRNATTSALSPQYPISGTQLYQQRLTALSKGLIYTRLARNSFRHEWLYSLAQPTYSQWKKLLTQEAKIMAVGQGSNRLTVILGDSQALWFPSDRLPRDRFWLNQGLSGDTTAGVLKRVSTFAKTRPNTIHVIVGINDLRKGKTDSEILKNLQQIMQQLRQEHPAAQIFVHSILPTRLAAIPSNRVRWLNYNIAALTQQEGVNYLNLQPAFTDAEGNLRRALTTDGVHLNAQGYQVWQTASAPIL